VIYAVLFSKQQGEKQMNAQIAWQQISISTKMAIGARHPMNDDGKGLIFQVGSGSKKKMVVRLNAMDLYDVQLVTWNSRTFQVVELGSATDVGCEELSETVYRLCNQ
jgi:hypothetical protein